MTRKFCDCCGNEIMHVSGNLFTGNPDLVDCSGKVVYRGTYDLCNDCAEAARKFIEERRRREGAHEAEACNVGA